MYTKYGHSDHFCLGSKIVEGVGDEEGGGGEAEEDGRAAPRPAPQELGHTSKLLVYPIILSMGYCLTPAWPSFIYCVLSLPPLPWEKEEVAGRKLSSVTPRLAAILEDEGPPVLNLKTRGCFCYIVKKNYVDFDENMLFGKKFVRRF